MLNMGINNTNLKFVTSKANNDINNEDVTDISVTLNRVIQNINTKLISSKITIIWI